MAIQKPEDFRYPSKFADVLGSNMLCVEHGSGDPIFFLHGRPNGSWLWRKRGACRAPWTDRECRRIPCEFPRNLCIRKEPAAGNRPGHRAVDGA